jgi:hypothetical protein
MVAVISIFAPVPDRIRLTSSLPDSNPSEEEPGVGNGNVTISGSMMISGSSMVISSMGRRIISSSAGGALFSGTLPFSPASRLDLSVVFMRSFVVDSDSLFLSAAFGKLQDSKTQKHTANIIRVRTVKCLMFSPSLILSKLKEQRKSVCDRQYQSPYPILQNFHLVDGMPTHYRRFIGRAFHPDDIYDDLFNRR